MRSSPSPAVRAGDVQTWSLSFGQKRDLIMNEDHEIRGLARPILEHPPRSARRC
jgi:hypothetical protein